MNTTITLTYSNLAAVVDRQLSIVGKRSTDENGKLIFTDITLGTNEKSLIDDYIRQAVIDLATETSAFISAGTMTAITLTFPSNHNAVLDTFIQQCCEAYCVSFALWSWFNIAAPRIAPRYLDDCKRQIASIVRLIHDKKSPAAAASSPLDIESEVVEREQGDNDDSDNNDNSD